MELLSKIERLSSENLRNEYVMETQLKKISELERTISELEAINSDNLSMIEALRMTNADQEESISEKAKIIKQIEQVLPFLSQDKEQVLQDFHKKNDEYNSLLSAYMKDKNIIAEKLNYMNEMEQSLLDKDRAIKEQ